MNNCLNCRKILKAMSKKKRGVPQVREKMMLKYYNHLVRAFGNLQKEEARRVYKAIGIILELN